MSTGARWKQLERQIVAVTKAGRRPVAITFLDEAPKGVKKFVGSEPSSCSFWRLAAEGNRFYTVPEDHFNCAVGAYTHHIALSPEREKETEQTLKMMFELGYVKPEEVPEMPRLAKTPKAILYAPLANTKTQPDVVVCALRPAGAMLLLEAVYRAGVGNGTQTMGRPSCMALPGSLEHGAILSLGCIGNRVHTGLGEDEMYVMLPGKDLEIVVEALETVGKANTELKKYSKRRRKQLSTR
ncbi:MAG: DUF169 domain-containing protein [Candidatus Acidiferrum sp.]